MDIFELLLLYKVTIMQFTIGLLRTHALVEICTVLYAVYH